MLRERIFGAALIAIGLAASYPRVELPFGTLHEPGAGFFPVVAGIALAVFAAFALFGRANQSDKLTLEPEALVGVAVLSVTIAACGALLRSVGFVPCAIVLLAVALRLGRVAWLPTLASATVAAIACYVLFTRLGMPLPAGILKF
ncbi:MAG: tripartite tricarboxylate transporter TctB family protein [Betaproteobacteria bacterium]